MSTSILVLYGSVTGNAEFCAEKLAREARDRGFNKITVESMASADAPILQEFDTILIVTSTYGDGEPPDGCESFYDAVVTKGGADLGGRRFSVLALGDTAYEQFCKCGKDFDLALERDGAQRIHAMVECDTDYDTPCEEWIAGVLAALGEAEPVAA